MKNFEQQYYRHKTQHPQAEFKIEEDGSLLTVSFSWGEMNATDKANSSLVNYYFASKNDIEVTSPFELLPSLTGLENKLRTGMLIANAEVYHQFNSKSFAAGCEYLCLATEGRELVAAQVGGPSVILVRKSENFLLSTNTDLAINNFCPLPSKLFGIENICYPQINSIQVKPDDFIVLISRSYLPSQALTLDLRMPLPQIIQSISKENPHIPFWLGRFAL